MKRTPKPIAAALSALVAAALLPGCDVMGMHNSPLPSALSVSAGTYQLPSGAEVQGNPLQISSSNVPAPKTQEDTIETKHGAAHPLPAGGKTAGKIRIDQQNAYSASRPTLVGVQLLSHIETIRRQFGKPLQEYVMKNGKDPMTVLDYGDFSLGFNQFELLQFIDISSSDIDAGLNGLRLGQTTQDAVQALGTPDTNTKYVLTYNSQGTILKLDADPETQIIRSITLFSLY